VRRASRSSGAEGDADLQVAAGGIMSHATIVSN